MLRQILVIAFLAGLFIFNIIELNRRKMGPIDFVLWQIGILILLVFAIFQDFGRAFSSALGFELLGNFVFTIGMISILILIRIQSRQIGKLQKQIQDLVQALALHQK